MNEYDEDELNELQAQLSAKALNLQAKDNIKLASVLQSQAYNDAAADFLEENQQLTSNIVARGLAEVRSISDSEWGELIAST